MTSKDIDFTKVSLPADEFDAMMRRALDAQLSPSQEKNRTPKGNAKKSKQQEGEK